MRQTMISTAYLTKRSGTTFADLVGETMELVNDFYRIPHKAVRHHLCRPGGGDDGAGE
jgi:hypothetical protein